MKLNCQSVTKTFQNQTAVDKVSFTLSEPMICGLLGRNGAGKTTLLRMIANRFQPAAGQILLDEQSVWENEQAQRQIFFATEGANFAEMKVRDVIRWMAAAYPNFDKEQCLNYAKQFELDLKKNNLKLSTGYKSVLRVVLALSVHTPLLLLDEPTLGMDAFHRELFYKLLIQSYSESPSCILLSTHLIGEVEGLLEHVLIIDHGKLLVDDSAEHLLNQGLLHLRPHRRGGRLLRGPPCHRCGCDRRAQDRRHSGRARRRARHTGNLRPEPAAAVCPAGRNGTSVRPIPSIKRRSLL